MFRFSLALIIAVCCYSTTHAQKPWEELILKIDSVKNGSFDHAALLVDICWQISEWSPDSAQFYCDLAEDIGKKISSDSILIRADLGTAAVFSFKGDHAKAIEKSFEALRKAEALKDTFNMADAVNNIGIDLYYQGEYAEALKYYELYASYSKSIGTLKQYANALNNMAMIQAETGNSAEEIKLYEEAIAIFEQIDDSAGYANTAVNLGKSYYNLQRYEESVKLYKNSFNYFSKNEYTSAVSELLIFWANSLEKLGRNKAALKKLQQSLEISRESNIDLQEMFAYESLHRLFFSIGQLDSAYLYQRKYQELYNSQREVEKQELIQSLKVEYETDKKEQQIAQLEQENKLKEIEADRQAQFQYFLILSALLLIAGLALLYSRYQLKEKTNLLLDQKNRELTSLNFTKDRLFSIISHDLKSPLSAFHTITKSLTENWDKLEKEQVKSFIENLRDSSKEVHDMMDNLLRWALSQTGQLNYNPQSVKPADILDDTIKQLQTAIQANGITLNRKYHSSVSIKADQDYLKIILRNLLSNAIKFSEMGRSIDLIIEENDQHKIISIKDYGVGMSSADIDLILNESGSVHDIKNSDKKGTGLGITLSKELLYKMGGKLEVESEQNKGSTFKLVFPKAA